MLTRREWLLLWAGFILSLPLVTTRLYASDEVECFAWLRSIAFDRDVNFRNEYQYFYDAGVARSEGFHETFLERTNELGRPVNYSTAGPALLWAPFYALGHVDALISGAPADGFSRPYIAAVAYGSACYGFLAVVLSAMTARRVLGRGLGTSLIIAFGTPLLFYAYLAPGFAHATSAFMVSLFVWLWIRVRESWTVRGAIGLGICGGVMGLVREQDVFLAIGPAVDFLLSWVQARRAGQSGRNRPFFAIAVAGGLAFLATSSLQLLAYKALNGQFRTTETAARKMTWTSPHGLQVLFSPEHGFLFWTPLALLAIAGLVAMRFGPDAQRVPPAGQISDVRRVASLAILMVLVQAYTSGCVESWTVAGSFGQRRFVALTPLLVLGLAAWFVRVRSGWPRRALLAAVVLCVWWNLGMMAQFGLNRMDRQRLTLLDNARMTFLELPMEAPRLAWRYLTNRESLFKLPKSAD